ncbi:MAG: MGH1-like glycoside hydrolase domain-containing protein [Candidatus Promineifilaceae bacterium]
MKDKSSSTPPNPEQARLLAYRNRESNWKQWGPYLSERAWGTVREDYSDYGSAWDYFPHDHARSRVYRWNEDGLAGISDRNQHLCFALALWNGKDPILKERLFGLAGPEGNHGEDVKEQYFYLDSTPTHSYMRMLYKYPQTAFPYGDLVQENRARGFQDFEYELIDTGAFDGDRYFDVFVEYAKSAEEDILVQIRVVNRSADDHDIHLLPTLWFRNTWRWGYDAGPMDDAPNVPHMVASGVDRIIAHSQTGTTYHLNCDQPDRLLFTENETNAEKLFNLPNDTPYVKDAFHRYLINGEQGAVNPAQTGTKAAAHFHRTVPAKGEITIRLRLTRQTDAAPSSPPTPFATFDTLYQARCREADQFYETVQDPKLSADDRNIQRQAFAGMMWSKQLYYYDIEQWLRGDPAAGAPPASRKKGRNHDWNHLINFDIISMPDKWEYPWYATWDLAFHCLPLVMIDPDFAKRQLTVLTREWYMHPNGQLPAYEWAFGDVNPPVHAWAAWRVYKIDGKQSGTHDRAFLEAVFHKLMLNFTWWVNRKDEDDNNVFQGGFLGLDNISVFDRSAELPTGGHLDQSDGTAWMGAYCLQLMTIALELAKENPIYQDSASKLFEHFLRIAHAMTQRGEEGYSLWDEADGFFYDALHLPDDSVIPLKVRSLVGLLPLFAVETLEPDLLEQMPTFERRMHWFIKNRPNLSNNMANIDLPGVGQRHLAALLSRERIQRVLSVMLDENEFLSPYGIRSLSKYHEANPYQLHVEGTTHEVPYWPAESQSGLFGGNSNWRGPVWFPINYLLIESLQKFYHYYGDDLKVELPTGSGNWVTLDVVATDLSQRLINLFRRNNNDRRPCYGALEPFQSDPHWRDLILFNEYFHGDNGAGLGASHQTGWTGLVAKLIQQSGSLGT